jgi:uncharacterized protein (TIRG00374 family)
LDTSTLRDIIKYISPVVIGVVTVLLGAIYTSKETLLNSVSSIRVEVILLIVCLVSISYIFRFVKWHYFFSVLDVKVDVKNNIIVFLSGLIMTITPGKGGEIWKSWLLEEREGIQKSTTFSVVVGERVTDILAFGFLSFLIVIKFDSYYVAAIVPFIILLLPFLLQYETVIALVENVVSKVGYKPDKIRHISNTFSEIFTVKSIFVSLLLSLTAWSLEGISLWILIVEISGNGFPIASTISTFSISSVIGAITLLPGGMLTTEASLVGILQLQGVSKVTAVQSGLLIRIMTLWYGVLVGLITYISSKIF